MTDKYKESGVDIKAGDAASSLAAAAAKTTFAGRRGMIGEPVHLPGGFAGVLDFGDFYVVQCCDTVGTKIDLAEKTGDFSSLGRDLLAMVADDAVCLGAEVVSITNTFETRQIESEKIGKMMNSLADVCREQKIVIAGGEIAEVGEKISGTSWGADAIGVVRKDRVITGENVRTGDAVIALKEDGFRCNGFSLVRKILAGHPSLAERTSRGCLRPSIVYHDAVLSVIGRFGSVNPNHGVTGIAHITGGGIPGNLRRILRADKLGARLDNLFEPCDEMKELQQAGDVNISEFYEVWNGGNGMLITCLPSAADTVVAKISERGVEAKVAGEVTDTGMIEVVSWRGEVIRY